jgi:hypothetical protein
MSAHSTAGMGLVGAHFERPALLRQKPVRISQHGGDQGRRVIPR